MKKILILLAMVLLCLTACSEKNNKVAYAISDEQAAQFTTNMQACHDKQYYILMGSDFKEDKTVAIINVFSDEGEYVHSFEAGNIENFRGACWEKDNYNIWTLSGDNTLKCYKFSDNQWKLDKTASVPEYMLKK